MHRKGCWGQSKCWTAFCREQPQGVLRNRDAAYADSSGDCSNFHPCGWTSSCNGCGVAGSRGSCWAPAHAEHTCTCTCPCVVSCSSTWACWPGWRLDASQCQDKLLWFGTIARAGLQYTTEPYQGAFGGASSMPMLHDWSSSRCHDWQSWMQQVQKGEKCTHRGLLLCRRWL